MENPHGCDSAIRCIPRAFAARLPVLNPLGSAPVLMGVVGDERPVVYRQLAWRIALGMRGFVAAIKLLGALILTFFGISQPLLQVAGGMTLAAIGWSMFDAHGPSPGNARPPGPMSTP
jgi:multiple antibiotic resistance protein